MVSSSRIVSTAYGRDQRPRGRLRVAARGADHDPLHISPEELHRPSGHDIRLARRRAHPEHRQEAGVAKARVQADLLAGDMEEAAEVDVVRPRPERRLHRRQVDAVGGRVHEHRRACERLRGGVAVADVEPGPGRLAAAVAGRHLACAHTVHVEARDLGNGVLPRQGGHDGRADDPARADHRDPAHGTGSSSRRPCSSCARSASHSSRRSRASAGCGRSGCSILRIR